MGTVETGRQQHIFRLLRQPPRLPKNARIRTHCCRSMHGSAMQALHTRCLVFPVSHARFEKYSFILLSSHLPHFFGAGRAFFGMVQPSLDCTFCWPNTSVLDHDDRGCTHSPASAQHALSSENGRDSQSLAFAAAHRAILSHSQATRHRRTTRGQRIVPALPSPRTVPDRACSHHRHPPTSKKSIFSPTQRLSAPSCRPQAPHPFSWHPCDLEHAWARPHRGRGPSARRLGPTQSHAPRPKPPETRAAGTTWYLQRRERAPLASGARTAQKKAAPRT